MADDNKTQFIVEVVKQGEGAAQARKELDSLNTTKQRSIAMANQLSAAYRFLATSVIAGVLLRELKASFQAFSEQEIAIAKLNGTLRASGQFTEEYSRELQALAGSLQQVTRFGDETILGVEQQLIAFGAARKDVPVLTELVLDLAEGMGTDLNAAALLVGKALAGEFSTLSRYGIIVNETASANEKLADALQQIDERFGGLARGAADTATGKVAQMSNAIGDLREEIGALLAISGGPLIEWITTLARELTTIVALARELKTLSPSKIADAILFKGIGSLGGGAAGDLGSVQSGRRGDESAARDAAAELAKARELYNATLARGVPGGSERRELELQHGREMTALLKLQAEGYFSTAEAAQRAQETIGLLHQTEIEQLEQAIELEQERAFFMTQTGQIALGAAQQFSAGFSRAFVDFASGTKEAGEAFKEFAGNFLASVGEMIIQTILLNAITRAIGGLGGGTAAAAGGAGNFTVTQFAQGGVAMVNQPTVLPKFNALAGEAGPEFLTVLRRPKMLSLGGMLAASGYIGNTPLSLVNTNSLRSKFAEGGVAGQLPGDFSGLASGGQGGPTEVVIRLSSGLRGEIVAESINGARVKIAQDMGDDSDVSRATKRLVA